MITFLTHLTNAWRVHFLYFSVWFVCVWYCSALCCISDCPSITVVNLCTMYFENSSIIEAFFVFVLVINAINASPAAAVFFRDVKTLQPEGRHWAGAPHCHPEALHHHRMPPRIFGLIDQHHWQGMATRGQASVRFLVSNPPTEQCGWFYSL